MSLLLYVWNCDWKYLGNLSEVAQSSTLFSRSGALCVSTEGINCAGVKWVIRLQLILLLMLFIAVLDFTVGSFVHTDPGQLSFIFL